MDVPLLRQAMFPQYFSLEQVAPGPRAGVRKTGEGNQRSPMSSFTASSKEKRRQWLILDTVQIFEVFLDKTETFLSM